MAGTAQTTVERPVCGHREWWHGGTAHHQQRLPEPSGEQGGGRGTHVEPPDGLRGGHPGGRTGAAAALCGHPAGHQRRVGGGLRRAAAGAQGRGDVAALRRAAQRQPQEGEDDIRGKRMELG